MDWLREKGAALFKKYRYVLLVLLAGIILMSLPEGGETVAEEVAAEPTVAQPDMEQRLEEILSQIQGAGKVEVLLTQASGEEIFYQTDEENSTSADSGTDRVETVIITGSDRSQTGLIRRVNSPTYLGAVVVCQGGDRPAVQLAIVEAVANATGLGTDKITVLKMK